MLLVLSGALAQDARIVLTGNPPTDRKVVGSRSTAKFMEEAETERAAAKVVLDRLKNPPAGKERTAWLVRDGERTQVWPPVKGGPKLTELPDGAIWAFKQAVSGPWNPPRERDMLVRDGEGLHPATLRVEEDGTITVFSANALEVPGPVVPMPKIERDFGVDLVEEAGRTFQPEMLRALDEALHLLTPAERARIEGVQIARLPELDRLYLGSWRPSQTPWTAYVEHELLGRVELSDIVPEEILWFVGPVDAPRSPRVLEVLEALGRAVADADRRKQVAELGERRRAHIARHEELTAWYDAFTEKEKSRAPGLKAERLQLQQALAEQEAEQKALDDLLIELTARNNPMIQSLMKAAGGPVAASPFTSESVSPEEAFASAFALYHVDPDALLWATPAVHAWFTTYLDGQ
ncbi:MAG: hypothetical protein KC656_10485 [Myxococcales bacterium]|nr:hypothetical protein [Myxococcales bacterium]